MNIIKKGKIFGVLNLLDIFIIFLVLVLILPMLHYYIKFNEKGVAEQKLLDSLVKRRLIYNIGFQTGPQSGRVDIYASFKNIKKEDIGKIKINDKDMLSDKTVLAEILWIGEPAENYYIVNMGSEDRPILTRTINDGLYSLPVKLRLSGIVDDNGAFSFKAKVMKQFGIYIFMTERYRADFVVEPYPAGADHDR